MTKDLTPGDLVVVHKSCYAAAEVQPITFTKDVIEVGTCGLFVQAHPVDRAVYVRILTGKGFVWVHRLYLRSVE